MNLSSDAISSFNLVDYLIENADKNDRAIVELLRYELETKLGQNQPQHLHVTLPPAIKSIIKDQLLFSVCRMKKMVNTDRGMKLLSSAYGSWNHELKKCGYDAVSPPWKIRGDFNMDASHQLYNLTNYISRTLSIENIHFLISPDFISTIKLFYDTFRTLCLRNGYIGIVVPQDVGFFEKMAIKVFMDIQKPTIFLAHGGMPSRYDKEFNNRTDYSLQWGKIQSNAYIKMGYPPEKLFEIGHPIYNILPIETRFNFNRILVITKSTSVASPMKVLMTEEPRNSIFYLYSVQKVLEQNGIHKAYFRPHPSEDYKWYQKYIDNSFYYLDSRPLSSSLKDKSLVIGPVSTTLIDSLFNGVNYTVYEPMLENRTLMNMPLVPPLDGTDERVPVATSENELADILQRKKLIDIEVAGEFVKVPRDLGIMNSILF
jgi:hypothetical protein